MISFDRAEALRYMGYRGSEPDAAVGESLTRCAADFFRIRPCRLRT